MILRPPRTTRTDTLFPDTTRFRSKSDARAACAATTVFQAKRHQNMNLDFSTIVLVVVVLLVFLIVVKAIAIVPQQHAWVVERLGKYDRTLSPGAGFVIPFIERVSYQHSLKEIPLDVPSQRSEARRAGKESVITCRNR